MEAQVESGGGTAREGRRILVVTPAHDEAAFLPETVACMEAQLLKPALWVIVDDGSTDKTGEIAAAAAARNPGWVRVLSRAPRKERSVGPGVVAAFSAGLSFAGGEDFDYLCKFDADLSFGPRLFAGLVERMEADPGLATLSGKAREASRKGRLRLLRTSPDFSLGMCKFYRARAYREIGGFVGGVMWDGIDCHRCRMLGWRARSVDEEEINFLHLRPMGSSHRSIFHGRRRWGRGQFFMGTHPLYIVAIAAYRLFEPPWLLGGLNILIGYLGAWIGRAPRYEDAEFRAYLRAWQLRRLRLGFLVSGHGRA